MAPGWTSNLPKPVHLVDALPALRRGVVRGLAEGGGEEQGEEEQGDHPEVYFEARLL